MAHWRRKGQTPPVFLLKNPMNSMKRQEDTTPEDESPRSVGTQYVTGDQWRKNSRKNDEMEPKQKQQPAVDVTGDGSKVRCCKEQYCIGTWNVRSMNQGKLEVIKQEMARVNIDIFSSVQFSSLAQSCPTLCKPMNRSTPGLPVHHQLPEFTQTHVH